MRQHRSLGRQRQIIRYPQAMVQTCSRQRQPCGSLTHPPQQDGFASDFNISLARSSFDASAALAGHHAFVKAGACLEQDRTNQSSFRKDVEPSERIETPPTRTNTDY